MSYWKNQTKNLRSIENFGLPSGRHLGGGGESVEFYELEPAIVLDIVLDENHPIFTQGNQLYTVLDIERWPSDLNDSKPKIDDKDFSWIGRALVRPIYSQVNTEKNKLIWAYPLDSNISEYPLINETVVIAKYENVVYYTRKLNTRNFVNNNINFGSEFLIKGKDNKELFDKNSPFKGAFSQTKHQGGIDYEGVAGRYFWVNNRIRAIKRFEGDLVIESRFGQSVRFSSYDSDRKKDKSSSKYQDYNGNGSINSFSNETVGGGNPMILIRNRQRPLLDEGKQRKPHSKLPPIIGTEAEKNAGGYLEEDINHDGTSIQITSGLTISKWVTTCYKQIFQSGMEEQNAFSPQGSTSFKFPMLDGDQIVINSDRLIFSSRYGETFHYSKKRYGVVTDSEFTVDAHDQIVMTTNTKTVINSPAIYLGEYNVTDEPILLGQTTVNWLYDLCNWLLEHNHWAVHSHKNAGKESPSQTQIPVQAQKLIASRDKLNTLMSRRVFTTGGGFAPGKDGASITDGTPPVHVSVSNGSGLPGGWKGKNKR